jgi:hypothetical protein
MKKHMHRRNFLRGLGGACVAAPFLSSLADRAARAQGATGMTPPKRLLVMFTHYGCITTKFFPAKAHGALTAADLDATTLKHLSPYVDKVLLPRGIRAMNEWTAGLDRGQGNDPHTQVAGTFFTCQPVTPNSDDPFSFNNATKFQAKPTGPSLDHVIAKQLSPGGTPLFMRVGNGNDSPQSAISYSAAEQAFPGYGTPAQAFSGLTNLFMDGEPMNPDTYAVVRGKSVVDLVKDEIEHLESFDMSGSDRQALEAWKELLHTTGGAVASAQCSEEVANLIGASKANVDKVPSSGLGTDILGTQITDTLDAADVYSNVAALSAICNANPVTFLKYPGSYVFRSLDLTTEAHSLSHRIGNAGMSGTCVAGVVNMLLKIDDYYARKFAHLVEVLNMVAEGDGKVLDNCAVVWVQEMSDGNAHNLNNLPIVQVGSAGGYFKTGWAVNVDDGSPTLSAGRSESLCVDGAPQQVNGTTQSTGTEADLANAPINKYYVNLMQALGVKAGEDGYAAEGGTAEVTKFGRYDRTEDFIGGGTKPANITSPGGFDALRAGAT